MIVTVMVIETETGISINVMNDRRGYVPHLTNLEREACKNIRNV